MISKLKTIIKFIIYHFINILIKPSKKIKPKSLLLIRLDAIGDYVLFRNFVEVLRKSENYNKYSITLLGNSAWKSLSEELDSEFVDEFVWLDRNRFNKDFIYRYKKLQEIASNGYEVVISPVYSREFFYGDTIVKLINAKEKIGSKGDLSNIRKWQKNISDKYYDRLIPAKEKIMFEFYRNKEFFENLLDVKLDIKKPYIKLNAKKISFDLPKNYAILFIGASASFRKWDIENFAKIGKFLKEKYNYEIVLCGGPSDVNDADKFKKFADYDYIDLVGKTDLIDILYIIQKSNLMVSNETSAPHLAVALDVKYIFVIYNGNHFGRFTPYPKEIVPNYYVAYHPKIEKDLNNYKKLSNKYGYGSKLNINEISFKMAKNKIEKILG